MAVWTTPKSSRSSSFKRRSLWHMKASHVVVAIHELPLISRITSTTPAWTWAAGCVPLESPQPVSQERRASCRCPRDVPVTIDVLLATRKQTRQHCCFLDLYGLQ